MDAARLGSIEVVRPHAREAVELWPGRRLTIGRGEDNDVVLHGDTAVSRVHAVVESVGLHWCVRDLASANGTFLNGERVLTERPLRHGDELRIGSTRVIVKLEMDAGESTELLQDQAPPRLTSRERDVLVALCRPVLRTDAFSEPASIREVAAELFVSDAAIKQHLVHLYAKFDIPRDGRRRVRLANEAVRRAAVTVADLRDER